MWLLIYIIGIIVIKQSYANIFVIELGTNMTVDYLEDLPANFGPDIPTDGIQVKVMLLFH